ncbi:MAG: glycine zipper 2TM domain-containing protein [Deltaproteobacteria bacterium]|nr:glycine zipper 2TM domain-containing protein [Deltaproteobacteria bacterium]MBW1911576.1 glycine zipper 2TM domain-containing protein [Deltaproteobacteria bacterium]
MKNYRISVIIAIILLIAGGCASSRSGQVYSRDQARSVHTVQLGTIEAINNVQIEGTKTKAGAIAGGAAGAALGHAVGSGSGKTIATVVGAVAGGLAGAAAEEGITKKDALEITVKLDDGEVIAIVQEMDEHFAVGDRIRVLTSDDGATRVRH